MVATPSTNGTTVPTFGVNVLRAALAKAHRHAPEHGARLDRAAAIVATRNVEPFGQSAWLVESERQAGSYYLVRHTPFGWDCLCADYRQRKLDCKHILAVRLWLARRKAEERPRRRSRPVPTVLGETLPAVGSTSELRLAVETDQERSLRLRSECDSIWGVGGE